MSTNKNATIRYQALDRCFRNPGRKYYINDLIRECNEALLEIDPESTGIQRRQLYYDIQFMKDSLGYNAPIESYKDGAKVFYRYTDINFSINNQPLNEQEAQQLKEALLTLSRFRGMPQFEWIEEIKARLEQNFNLKTEDNVISFEENPFLSGLSFIDELYNSIVNKQTLIVEYKPFKKSKSQKVELHPYHLKQYNNRWFLFGYNSSFKSISNLAIDRIIAIQKSKAKYLPNKEIDFEEFFEDVVGVSVKQEVEHEKVILKISAEKWPYVESKPIHGSQKIKIKNDKVVIIELSVQVNYELIALLFSLMEGVEIIEPVSLRKKFKGIAENIYKRYI